jgi:hypothetical protein
MDQPRPRRATWRMGARERMRLQGVFIAIICILLFFAFKPYFVQLGERKQLQLCETNMRKIAHGMAMYQDDWDGAFPQASAWMNSIGGLVSSTSGTGRQTSDIFHCPLDHSGTATSYVYNDPLQGISLTEASNDPEKEARRKRLRNPGRMPILIENYGGALNASADVWDWDTLGRILTMEHKVPEPTGVIVTADGSVERITKDILTERSGKRF